MIESTLESKSFRAALWLDVLAEPHLISFNDDVADLDASFFLLTDRHGVLASVVDSGVDVDVVDSGVDVVDSGVDVDVVDSGVDVAGTDSGVDVVDSGVDVDVVDSGGDMAGTDSSVDVDVVDSGVDINARILRNETAGTVGSKACAKCSNALLFGCCFCCWRFVRAMAGVAYDLQ
jgi:hypothetical protein